MQLLLPLLQLHSTCVERRSRQLVSCVLCVCPCVRAHAGDARRPRPCRACTRARGNASGAWRCVYLCVCCMGVVCVCGRDVNSCVVFARRSLSTGHATKTIDVSTNFSTLLSRRRPRSPPRRLPRPTKKVTANRGVLFCCAVFLSRTERPCRVCMMGSVDSRLCVRVRTGISMTPEYIKKRHEHTSKAKVQSVKSQNQPEGGT